MFFVLCFGFFSTNNSQDGLTEDDVAVKHRLPLFLDLPPPPLLGMLHLVQHVGSRVRTGQNVVSVGKRLLVLKTHRHMLVLAFPRVEQWTHTRQDRNLHRNNSGDTTMAVGAIVHVHITPDYLSEHLPKSLSSKHLHFYNYSISVSVLIVASS